MASRSHRRAPRRRHPLLISAVAVAAVAAVVSLVLVLRPGDGAGSGPGPATAAAAPRALVPAQTSGTATPTATGTRPEPLPSSPSASASPSPTASPTTTPTADTSSARSEAADGGRPAPATAPQAGRIRPGTTYRGVATHYDAGDGNGACSFGPSDDLMIAAMNTTDYASAQACGAHVLVRAANGATVTVLITNECPLPCAPGQLDLSRQAFAKLADPVTGRIAVTWSLLSPSTSEPLSIRYKTGSSRYWCGIQALGHRNPLARLEVRAGAGWRALPRTGYNYFLSEQGAGCGGSLRLTDIYGERLVIDGMALRPDVVQRTGVQFARH
ncbi:expansin EXLX1 family cellulose-binding protein [Streptomyces sp. bgisy153]|uniref:expansin EXLX1 family cellulose-binding protein n=1 Tax=Streptomyces sp. bgisy153 TaxID=3413793 RepID=UPI003D71CB66